MITMDLPYLTKLGRGANSALVSTIAIYDLTMRGQVIIADSYLAFEIWFTIAAIYLAITVALSTMVNRREIRFRLAT